jgi:hypothetical protein
MVKRKSVSKKRVSKKRVSKKRVSKKRVSKKRVSKRRSSRKRVSKKRVSKRRSSKKRVSRRRKHINKLKGGVDEKEHSIRNRAINFAKKFATEVVSKYGGDEQDTQKSWEDKNITRNEDGKITWKEPILPTPWVEYTSKKLRQGQPYYHNTDTNETTWVHPSPVSVPDDGAAAADAVLGDGAAAAAVPDDGAAAADAVPGDASP